MNSIFFHSDFSWLPQLVPRSLVFAHHAVFMAKLWIKSHPYDNQQLAISEPRKSGRRPLVQFNKILNLHLYKNLELSFMIIFNYFNIPTFRKWEEL